MRDLEEALLTVKQFAELHDGNPPYIASPHLIEWLTRAIAAERENAELKRKLFDAEARYQATAEMVEILCDLEGGGR